MDVRYVPRSDGDHFTQKCYKIEAENRALAQRRSKQQIFFANPENASPQELVQCIVILPIRRRLFRLTLFLQKR